MTSKIKVKAFPPNKSGFQFFLIILHPFWCNLCNMKLPTGPNYKGQHDQREKNAKKWESENLGYILAFCQQPSVAMHDFLKHSGPLFHPW